MKRINGSVSDFVAKYQIYVIKSNVLFSTYFGFSNQINSCNCISQIANSLQFLTEENSGLDNPFNN